MGFKAYNNNPKLSCHDTSITWTNAGKYTAAWIDAAGYKGEIHIGNETYITKPANESAIILCGTKSSADRRVSQVSSKKLSVGADNNLTVRLEVKTTYELPVRNHVTVLGHSLNYTSYRQESENVTFQKTFKTPALLPAFNAPKVYVTNYNNSHAIVNVPNVPGIVKIDYKYNNSTCSEYRLIGYVGTVENGFNSTEYKSIETFIFDNSGEMSRSPSGLYIKGQFDISKLNVTVVTPYDSFKISHFEYTTVDDNHLKIFNWSIVGFLGFFFIYGRAVYKVVYMVIRKWI